MASTIAALVAALACMQAQGQGAAPPAQGLPPRPRVPAGLTAPRLVPSVIPGARPEQIIERFDNKLREVSRSTFGIKPICATPRDKLQFIEIPVLGLDCKACCLAAYEAVYKLEGVEQATASFKDGLVTAWIDPQQTNREKLEAALKQRNVTLKPPPGE